ncbi:hypothetical protein HXT23_04405 [Gardnerella sp. DNF00257]|uniref:hypothetical protein n=1 Tax=Gardnerella sp. DNF00257 TaxID=2749045 RepID=UPI003BB11772
MMNKKAIAAFAAGATLLAGFAMATPAFAADGKGSATTEVKKPTSYKEAQDAANTAAANLESAKNTAKEKETAAETKKAAVPAQKPNDADGVKLVLDQKTGKYEVKEEGDTIKPATKTKLQEYADKYNANVDAQAAAEAAKKDVATAQAAYDAAVLAMRKFAPVADKEDDDYAVQLSASATRLKTATKKLKDAFAKADKLYREQKVAQAKANNAAKTVADFENNHDMTGLSKSEKAEYGRLVKASTDAKDKADNLSTKYTEASTKFGEALTAYREAFAAYKTNFYAAKDHKEALVLGYSTPEDIELLDSDFQPGRGFVGSSNEVSTPGAPAGQAGAAAQPGAAAGKAGAANGAAAGAKTEVENKNGKDKRGNTHTGTGVGVTLTALAATMLAGMGAAVRKARH